MADDKKLLVAVEFEVPLEEMSDEEIDALAGAMAETMYQALQATKET